MVQRGIFLLNASLGGIIVFILLIAGITFLTTPQEIPAIDLEKNKRTLPANSFVLSQEACDSIGKKAFDLKFSPSSLQLPDLRHQIIYLGKNGRPDALIEKPILHFSLLANGLTSTVAAGEKLYLIYDRTKTPSQYIFSQNNSATSLWIEPTIQGNEVLVKLGMLNENGELIQDPKPFSQFTLHEKDSARPGGKVWEMGIWRVDGSLLARQKARWIGLDRFLELHGGQEYSHMQNKHRIDFTDEEETYCVYVGVNDCLIWKDRWVSVNPGQDSLAYPLMVVKKIDDRIMNLELWDVGGRNKVVLNLIRITESWTPKHLEAKFKCLGARTRSQYIFEVDNNRILLRPHDWLLQTESGWIKLTTAQQIDDFVARKLSGVLFICEGIERVEGKQVLKATLFNAPRTEVEEIEIPVQQSGPTKTKESVMNKHNTADDDDDDDADEDGDDQIHRIPPAGSPHAPIVKQPRG